MKKETKSTIIGLIDDAIFELATRNTLATEDQKLAESMEKLEQAIKLLASEPRSQELLHSAQDVKRRLTCICMDTYNELKIHLLKSFRDVCVKGSAA